MIIAGIVLSCYVVIAAVAWAWVAHSLGEHYGEEHSGERSASCLEVQCTKPVQITLLISALWPIFSVVGIGLWWHSFWKTAGSNGKLPPENEHPAPRKKAPDVEFLP